MSDAERIIPKLILFIVILVLGLTLHFVTEWMKKKKQPEWDEFQEKVSDFNEKHGKDLSDDAKSFLEKHVNDSQTKRIKSMVKREEIDREEIEREYPPEEFTTYFRSAIAFGKARVLEEPAEKRAALAALAKRYSPDETEEALAKEIDGSFNQVVMVEISIDHLSGKEAIEFVKQKNAK